MVKMHRKITIMVDVAFDGLRCGTYDCEQYQRDQIVPRCTLFQTNLGYVNNEDEEVKYPNRNSSETFTERLWEFIRSDHHEARCKQCIKIFGEVDSHNRHK